MGSTKTKTKSQETAVTQPNIPYYAEGPVTNYYGKVNSLIDLPASGVALPANNLLNSAYDSASDLGGVNYFSQYDNANRIMNGARNLAPVSAVTANGPGALTATNARMPAPFSATNVANVAAPTTAQARLADYGPLALAGDGSGYGGDGPMSAGGSRASEFLNDYLNPQLSQLRDTTMAEYWDQAGRDRAAYAARGALNKAFGGSRYGIGEAQLLSDQARKGALTDAELFNTAWNNALTAGAGDADRATSASIASMQSGNQFNTALADRLANLSMFNAGAVNDRSQSIFDAGNELGMFNAGQSNDMAAQVFDALVGNARQDASSANDINKLIYGETSQTNRQNASEANRLRETQYTTQADLSKFNANAQNDINRTNADRALQGLGLALDANGQLVSMADNEAANKRADIALQGDIGGQLQQIMQNESLAPYIQAGLLNDLIDPALLQAISGQTINTSGTSTSKQSGGLLQSLLGAGAQLGSAAIMASERRVKRGIDLIGREPDGLGVYRYNYLWDDAAEAPRVGVMADEVGKIRPWALGPVVDGVQTVNYGAL